MAEFIFRDEVIGQRFGRLIVIAKNGSRKVLCRCDCGTTKTVRIDHIRAGASKSCGCLSIETTRDRLLRHGHSRKGDWSRTYSSWAAMKRRCLNPRVTQFSYYGGRGITICQRWLDSFEHFLADMGERPAGMSLDRYPNNNGNYEPDNCRWATRKQQSQNRRDYGSAKA